MYIHRERERESEIIYLKIRQRFREGTKTGRTVRLQHLVYLSGLKVWLQALLELPAALTIYETRNLP